MPMNWHTCLAEKAAWDAASATAAGTGLRFKSSGRARDVLQPPVFVTAALKINKINLLSPGPVAARRSRLYKTWQNSKFVFYQLHELCSLSV